MTKTIYHGSELIVQTPSYKFNNSSNDYGRGFYCTEDIELAKEWACKNGNNGFANEYSLNLSSLNICYLNSDEYNILNWLALLTKNRSYWQKKSIGEEAKKYLQDNYLIDTRPFDVIIGYRADDSYFSFAQDFIMGVISLQKLSTAMHLGKLGEQIVLKSNEAFGNLTYKRVETALAEEYYTKKCQRDIAARRDYADTKTANDYMDDIFIIDFIRGKVNNDDLRL